MIHRSLLAFALSLSSVTGTVAGEKPGIVAVAHTYEARIRLDGKVSTTRVQATDAGHAKKLVQAQYGPKVTVLSVKRVD